MAAIQRSPFSRNRGCQHFWSFFYFQIKPTKDESIFQLDRPVLGWSATVCFERGNDTVDNDEVFTELPGTMDHFNNIFLRASDCFEIDPHFR